MTEEDLKAVCTEWYITHGDREVGWGELSKTILKAMFELDDKRLIIGSHHDPFTYKLTPKAIALIKS